jgi:hypothetical protein
MKSLNHHLPPLTRILPGKSDGILKEVEDHGGQNIENAMFLVHHLILTLLHLKVQ